MEVADRRPVGPPHTIRDGTRGVRRDAGPPRHFRRARRDAAETGATRAFGAPHRSRTGASAGQRGDAPRALRCGATSRRVRFTWVKQVHERASTHRHQGANSERRTTVAVRPRGASPQRRCVRLPPVPSGRMHRARLGEPRSGGSRARDAGPGAFLERPPAQPGSICGPARGRAATTQVRSGVPPGSESGRHAMTFTCSALHPDELRDRYSRAMSPATKPAPNPLSTFTTVTFGAQEFSIASSAERPPIDAP